MGLLGKIIGKTLALPVRIVNAPLDAGEKALNRALGDGELKEEDRIISAPGKIVGDVLEQAGKDIGDSISGEEK